MMKRTSWCLGMAVLAMPAMLAVGACSSQKDAEQQKKVDELQAQLDAVKKELAANSAADAPAEAPPPAAAPAAPAPPPASKPPAAASAPASRSQSPEYVTAEQGRKAKEALEKQQAVNLQQAATNERQAATNERVQTQIEDLKSREYTIPAGTVI